MVLLTATPSIVQAISSLPHDSRFRTENTTLPTSPGSPVSHRTLIQLSKCIPNVTLDALLRGTKVYVPPPPPKAEPSEEYKALMARLHADQERREYKALLEKREAESQQALSGQTSEETQKEEKDDISPSLIFNMLLSVVMCAWVAFYLTRWWPNDGIRVLVSLGTAVVVGVAEVTVYAAYLRKVEDSRSKEKRKRERKEFIGQFEGEESFDAWGNRTQQEDQVEKTEIWGRGVHGGMRRRVRDKWEKEQDQNAEKT